MLDAASRAGMSLGAARASIASLTELHLLLSQRGLRRSSSGVHHTDREDKMTSSPRPYLRSLVPDAPGSQRQLSMAFESPDLQGM
ncbi:MAG TPA: hypothetical protein VGM97_08290 [Steroidobacteraceae bacterium]|jgi:hypothetical protein